MNHEGDILHKDKISKIFYIFFSVFSFIIIPFSIFLLININFKLYTGKIYNGLYFAPYIMAGLYYSSILCIISFIIFILLIIIKKFKPSLFSFPFILIFLLTNYFNYDLFMNLSGSNFNLDSIKFFFQLNFMFLPVLYIPFVILFIIIISFLRIKNLFINKP